MLRLAETGALAGVTVINDVGLANALVDKVRYVVLRMAWSDHDPTTIHENSEADGRRQFVEPRFWWSYAQADPRVILQYGNEENIFADDKFYIGLMKEAEAHGRKVCIFNDSVGTTEDYHWQWRTDALIYAADHGHYVGLHAYGYTKDGKYHPLVAWDNPGDWRWYGGRWKHLYDTMPDVQPKLILTEAGAGSFQQSAGAENWRRDVAAMDEFVKSVHYLCSFNWWTMGGEGVGFDLDSLDGWL